MTRIVGHKQRRRPGALALMASAAGVLLSVAVSPAAQAQPVVQPLPDPATYRLNEALRQLAQDPRSINALVDAGQASIALEDPESALGFFRRAEAVNPNDGRVKAGLAAVMVRQGQPLEALRLYDEAEKAGEAMLLHAPDRGLAFDLIGDNVRAQKEYSASLNFAPDPRVVQRLALSQAIAGNQAAAEATLLPLLQKSDLSAYRTRAFSLAILGKSDEAVTIAETMLPERLSSRLAPYLRYMPRLTRAQQAAAANLGTFPPAAQIGRDDPAVVAYAAQLGVLPSVPASAPSGGSADSRLVPAGEPLGRRDNTSRIPRREEVPAPQPAAPPTPAPTPPRPAVQAPQVAQVPQPQPIEPPRPAPVVVSALPQTPAPPPAPVPEEPPPPPTQDLVEAFSDLAAPATRVIPADGAVDMSKFEPRRDPPPRPAVVAPPKPVIPSRHWVQIATGRDTDALAFDWRRLKRSAGGLLDKSKPQIADWGQTNRLLVGPFPSAKEANEFVADLKKKNLDSFRFTSAQGEEVKPLD
ncbi:SPOR domain-containing protein [Croceibacterium sp. LX-88]|uniref:SPOR domain-containing protein n=1 Tax=Croceibacterium selenioxidans TaxID=2838833 RepID=A0ABS5W8I9_9SPHN|nr:SPOR domain-containing protein [Croceibacterium selenioxidans]MBT2135841.1 SPOR domain-containing protein [Croceibacterium selenioxidans]